MFKCKKKYFKRQVMSVIGQFITTLRNTAADCLNIHNDCRSGKYLTSRCIAAFKDRFNLFKAAVTWHIMMQTCIKIDFIFQNMQKVLIVFLEKIQVEQIVTSRLMTAILFNKFQQVFLDMCVGVVNQISRCRTTIWTALFQIDFFIVEPATLQGKKCPNRFGA